jgi:hypothetical protein
MDPRYAWMVTLSGDANRLGIAPIEGVEVTREGASWLQTLLENIEGLANGPDKPLNLDAGEWALYAERFERMDDSIPVTHAAQAILDDAGLSDVRPALIVKRVTEATGFGYSIWSPFDSLYIGADSPVNPDRNPGGR